VQPQAGASQTSLSTRCPHSSTPTTSGITLERTKSIGLKTMMDEARAIECGEDAAKHFSFADGYVNLNHGVWRHLSLMSMGLM
jgi:hypothetical protein